MQQIYDNLLKALKGKNSLLIATSNRWGNEFPKTTMLALMLNKELGNRFIDASKLNIHHCEGNVSSSSLGNHCGEQKANLTDLEKNPSQLHRCWASINNPDDELWKISKLLLDEKINTIVFFGSIRWGKANSIYAKLLERLTWLENRHTSFNEENILAKKQCGIVLSGHNFNVEKALELEKENLKYFGFNVKDELCYSKQWTLNIDDESLEGYQKEADEFKTWKKPFTASIIPLIK